MTKFPKARSKLDRAGHAISNFNKLSYEFFQKNSYSVVTELSPSKKEKIWRFRLANSDTLHLSNEVDDIVANIRNPLDIAIADMAFAHAGRRDRSYFPMGKDKESFERQLKEKTKDLPHDAQEMLLKLAPYSGGDLEILWHLHLLNIDAKHRGLQIIDTQGGMRMTELQIFGGRPYIIGSRFGPHLIVDGYQPKVIPFAMTRDIEFLTTSPEAYYQGDLRPTFSIVFSSYPEAPAAEVLAAMHASVSTVLDLLETA